MPQFFQYILAYGFWFVDLGIAAFFAFITRTVLFAVPSVFFHPGNFQFPKRAEVMDKGFTILLGIGLLTFMVITLEYYLTGARKGDLIKRFAKITGPIVLCIFIVDSILFYLQGMDAFNSLRLLIILVELVVGILLVIYSRKNSTSTL